MRLASLRSLCSLALLASLAVLPACTSDAPAPDGGSTGGDAGGMDAGLPPPTDAGRAQACEGTANPCVLLMNGEDCSGTMGCGWTQCAGFAVECGDHPTEALCTGAAGCAWTGTVCGGTATECSALLETDACAAQAGCTWSTRAQCRGLSIGCDVLDAETCTSQPGCRPYTPRVDAGPRDSGPPPMCDADGGRPEGCVVPAPPTEIVGCNEEHGVECDGDWQGINPRTGAEFCSTACSTDQCCSPRDGRFQCVARHDDGSCPAADIYIDASYIETGYAISETEVEAGSCTIVEGCVSAPGTRRLLRFDTYTPNIGEADLFLGEVPDDGVATDVFEWSACHGHHHFDTYASYELISNDLCCVSATGHKQAFCLMDLSRHDPAIGSDRAAYSCGYQGIQRGWQDIYSAGLACQWIDITDVPPGDYILRVRVNVDHILYESDYSNNEINVPVHID